MIMLISVILNSPATACNISIHLMLMLICKALLYYTKNGRISIHLMLMLILIKTGNENEVNTNFNTSHVNVNPTNLSLFNHA